MSVFARVFSAAWGHRSEDLPRVACPALRTRPGPTSLADLLKPEYKGKVALNGDPTQAGAAFAGVVMASRNSAYALAPICSRSSVRSARYHATGSALMTRSGTSGCAKKNQCHHAVAKRASPRSSASAIGTPSSTAT